MPSDSGPPDKFLDTLAETRLISKNVTIIGVRRTSIRLEPSMWQALQEISVREGRTINEICTLIYQRQTRKNSLTAMIRVFILAYYREATRLFGGDPPGRLLPDPEVLDRITNTPPAARPPARPRRPKSNGHAVKDSEPGAGGDDPEIPIVDAAKLYPGSPGALGTGDPDPEPSTITDDDPDPESSRPDEEDSEPES